MPVHDLHPLAIRDVRGVQVHARKVLVQLAVMADVDQGPHQRAHIVAEVLDLWGEHNVYNVYNMCIIRV